MSQQYYALVFDARMLQTLPSSVLTYLSIKQAFFLVNWWIYFGLYFEYG